MLLKNAVDPLNLQLVASLKPQKDKVHKIKNDVTEVATLTE